MTTEARRITQKEEGGRVLTEALRHGDKKKKGGTTEFAERRKENHKGRKTQREEYRNHRKHGNTQKRKQRKKLSADGAEIHRIRNKRGKKREEKISYAKATEIEVEGEDQLR